MIVRHSEETCKENFTDRVEVLRFARELVCRGLVVCALCAGFLSVHGSYPRRTLDEDGNRTHGWVAQGHCAACKAYPALLPDFIMPYKHYEAAVIERVIAESEGGGNVEHLGGCAPDVSTMRRWIAQFGERGVRAVGWLCSLLLDLHGRQISLLKLQNRTLLKQLARLLGEFPTPKNGGILGKANIILTTKNCGFL